MDSMARQPASAKTVDNMRKAIHAFNQRYAVAYKNEMTRYKSQGINENPLETSPILAEYRSVVRELESRVSGILQIDTSRGTIKESAYNLEMLKSNYLAGTTDRAYAVREITRTLKETTTAKIVTDITVSAKGLKDGTEIAKLREQTEKEIKKAISKRGKKEFNEKIKNIHNVYEFIRDRNAMIDSMFAFYYDSEGVHQKLIDIDWNPLPSVKEWESVTGRTLDNSSQKDVTDFIRWLIDGKPNEQGKKTDTTERGKSLDEFMNEKHPHYDNDEGMIKK